MVITVDGIIVPAVIVNHLPLFFLCELVYKFIENKLKMVSKNGEKSAKFMFFFRKKNYLNGIYAVTKFATS